ncbi:MAG: orotidine 5'-phosphate decarboxylase [Clostridia bacterium]|nr:orotidine 5'-phosphate decarboxylase [Clostridia bacterium]
MDLLMALDFTTIPEAKLILREVGDGIDIVEVGTPFIVREGMRAVAEIRRDFPAVRIFADLKIMDAGAQETECAIQAGADIVSVLGVAAEATILACVQTAHKHGKAVLADMIAVPDIAKRAAEIDLLGVDYICVHTAFDLQASGTDPLSELLIVSQVVKQAKVAVAGGVRLETLPEIVKAHPSIVIVGGALSSKSDKRKAAMDMRALMRA